MNEYNNEWTSSSNIIISRPDFILFLTMVRYTYITYYT